MKRKKVIIVGAGISGLAAGFYLRKTHLPLDIVYLEKDKRAGGWIHTDYSTSYLFEKGPRAFKADKAPALLNLVRELEMESDLVFSEARPYHRYIWHEGALHRFPTHPLSFLFSPLTKGFVRALLTEWKQPSKIGDETVWEFVLRRFNYDVARLFFDPLVVGIFGGDIRKISIKACFPMLKQWEEEKGSLTKGFLQARKEKKHTSKFSLDIPNLPLSSMFSFRLGIEMLPKALLEQVDGVISYETEVKSIQIHSDHTVTVESNHGIEKGDFVILACPSHTAASLLRPLVPQWSEALARIHSQGITVVNVGYPRSVLPVNGFGYLTSTYSNEDVLGVVFDSSVFPSLNKRPSETRLTIKLEESGKSEEESIHTALRGIRRHLNLSHSPDAIHCKRACHAIPQYGVGHLEMMDKLDKNLRSELPHCFLVGNYIKGVSVDACISRARNVVETQIAPLL